MKLFGQIISTIVNVATLPVTLPCKIFQDLSDPYTEEFGDHTKELIEKIKKEAQENDS